MTPVQALRAALYEKMVQERGENYVDWMLDQVFEATQEHGGFSRDLYRRALDLVCEHYDQTTDLDQASERDDTCAALERGQ